MQHIITSLSARSHSQVSYVFCAYYLVHYSPIIHSLVAFVYTRLLIIIVYLHSAPSICDKERSIWSPLVGSGDHKQTADWNNLNDRKPRIDDNHGTQSPSSYHTPTTTKQSRGHLLNSIFCANCIAFRSVVASPSLSFHFTK